MVSCLHRTWQVARQPGDTPSQYYKNIAHGKLPGNQATPLLSNKNTAHGKLPGNQATPHLSNKNIAHGKLPGNQATPLLSNKNIAQGKLPGNQATPQLSNKNIAHMASCQATRRHPNSVTKHHTWQVAKQPGDTPTQ